MTLVALRSRHRGEDIVEAGLGAVGIAGLEPLEAHRDVAAVTAPGAAEARTVAGVIVVQHQADAHALERVEDLAQRATQDVKKGIGRLQRQVAFCDQRIAFVAVARRRAQVRPVVEREHDHGLAAWRQSGTRVHVDIRIVGSRRSDREHQRGQGRRDASFDEFGIHTGISAVVHCFGTSTRTPSVICSWPSPSSTRS